MNQVQQRTEYEDALALERSIGAKAPRSLASARSMQSLIEMFEDCYPTTSTTFYGFQPIIFQCPKCGYKTNEPQYGCDECGFFGD